MINVNKLKGKIIENGLTMKGLSEKMGIDRTTLNRKLSSGGDKLTVADMQKIIEILNLKIDEAKNIFFNV